MVAQPEIDNILKLWRHVLGGGSGLLQVFTAARDDDGTIDPESLNTNYFAYPKAAAPAAVWALEKSEEGREIYYCSHLLTEPRRVKENASEVRSLWGDLDGAPIPNGPLEPTAVVESSPGHYHAYWRLDESVQPETAEQLNRRIAEEIGADPSGFDLTQLLRVPGTTNHKREDRPLVRVLELDGARELSPHDLDELLPKPEERPRGRGGEVDPPVALGAVGLAVWSGIRPKYKEGSPGEIDKSATLLKIGRVLYDAGATRAVVTAALAERDVALGYRKFADRPDAEQRYDEIFDE